jgi:anti-sigma factor RsiW
VNARLPHLQDDSLTDCYFAERRGEALDPPAAEHLADCQSCSERYAEFERFMASLRDEADAELDTWFPADRLRAQQHEIARRLESIGRAARVISFPGRIAARRTPSSSRRAARWIAGAAAAGLFVGVAAGTFFDFGNRFEFGLRGRHTVAQRSVREMGGSTLPARMGTTPAVTSEADDMFMSALDLALDRPHTSELVAFDALTPHVREIGLTR